VPFKSHSLALRHDVGHVVAVEVTDPAINDCSWRILRVAGRSCEGPLLEPTAAAQANELNFLQLVT
jgi:hypothetical protein